MFKSVLVLAALASAAVTAPAMAAPVSKAVRTADLNLSTAAGRDTLSRRISNAAETVCIVPGDRSLVAMVEGQKCYNRAVSAARLQVASVSGGSVIASR